MISFTSDRYVTEATAVFQNLLLILKIYSLHYVRYRFLVLAIILDAYIGRMRLKSGPIRLKSGV